jgi:hypothetical protein
MLRIVALTVSLFLCANPSYAGWLGDAIKDAVEQTGKKAVDEAADSTYEGAKEAGKKTIDKGQEEATPNDSGKTTQAGRVTDVKVYPGAMFDAATTNFLKDSLSVQGACYRTNDKIDPVVAFYQKHKGLKLVSKTAEGAMFQLNEGAAQGGVDVTIQRPWMNMKTNKMMNDTLISIVGGQ